MFIVYPNGKHKSIRVSSKYSDSKYLARLQYRIGKKAYRLAKRNKGKSAGLEEKEIADIYSGNGTAPKVIEFSDNVGDNSKMRAYKVITENSESRFHNNSADMYLAKKKYDKAVDQYYEALKHDKKSQRAYYGLALVHFKVAKIKKGFTRLKLLRKAKSFLKIGKTYTGSYIPAMNKLSVKIIKAENKENKKYKSYK